MVISAHWQPKGTQVTCENEPRQIYDFYGFPDEKEYSMDRCSWFCHREEGDVWELTEKSNDPKLRESAIQGAWNCPAGRLIPWNKKTRQAIEPKYEPSIGIIEDPPERVSGPIWVRGGIPIESCDGTQLEVRNQVTLCRCGKSQNKPFCDATHVPIGYLGKK